MTDYVELMMRTAGVEPTITYFEAVNPLAEISSGKLVTKERNFTAEKQLEIVKLIASKETYSDEVAEFAIYHKNNLWGFEFFVEGGYTAIEFKNKDFTQALAQLTTELMKANELDKEKVKGVLEGC